MRLKIVAANWKMNTTYSEGIKLAENVIEHAGKIDSGKLLLFAPPFTHIHAISELVKGHKHIGVSAQNCSHEKNGAITGEVSAAMIYSAGAKYVIVGHSERRTLFHESEEVILKKMKEAVYNKLNVIYCCGEPLEVRENGKHKDFVSEQLNGSLLKLPDDMISHLCIAYEPIWAIGTGKTAKVEEAQEMHAHIRSMVNHKFGKSVAAEMPVIYGGSLKISNARELFSQRDVDGGLVGGASLNADEFAAIVNCL
jgi:triosephosphate isomerase (TIM)